MVTSQSSQEGSVEMQSGLPDEEIAVERKVTSKAHYTERSPLQYNEEESSSMVLNQERRADKELRYEPAPEDSRQHCCLTTSSRHRCASAGAVALARANSNSPCGFTRFRGL